MAQWKKAGVVRGLLAAFGMAITSAPIKRRMNLKHTHKYKRAGRERWGLLRTHANTHTHTCIPRNRHVDHETKRKMASYLAPSFERLETEGDTGHVVCTSNLSTWCQTSKMILVYTVTSDLDGLG